MIQCKRCKKKQYLGETKRTLRERFKERRQATNDPLHANATAAVPWRGGGGGGRAAVSFHFNQPGHSIADMELILLELQPTLSMPPPVTLHSFPLCVLKRCSPLHFERKPNLSKTLKGLLMRLVIFENTIFQLNSLNITVFVCHVSGSKVNRKERSRPSLFVCFFVPPC